jgi:hypothetical protein
LKSAGEYEIGEHVDGGEYCSGKVVSLLRHPTRASMAYMMMEMDDGTYTAYGCLTDAKSGLFLARNVPRSVMIAMLFDVFLAGGTSITVEDKVPVVTGCLDQPVTSPRDAVTEKRVSEKRVAPESVLESSGKSLPEFDFP